MRFCCCAIALCLCVPHAAALPVPAFIPVQASAAPEDASAAGAPVSAEAEQKLRAFLDRFVDARKTPAEQAAMFAEPADYYEHGIVGREDIRRDVERYVRHWPYRHYTVSGIEYLSADPASDRIFVSYMVEFEVARGSRHVRGTARYGAVIRDVDGAPKVESIKEKVNSRRAGSND